MSFRKTFLSLMIFGSLLVAAPVYAIELEAAKAQGLVGETTSGYLAAVSAPSGEVQQLVQRINNERRSKYQQIAAKNGTPLKAVEALAAKKAIEMTPAGQFVQTGGKWVKK